jgi:2-polyprenyl-6-methoxyphenol hydroxylase-like FAD-dependent oxidoreductase
MNKTDRRIAILGAGGTGVCTALELAQRGYKVDLYEKSAAAVSKASYVNEGKIHLGYIYAMDKDLHTAKKMIMGALHFVSNLKRWISLAPEDVISTPFYYGVHRDSLMEAPELHHHYQKCNQLFDEARDHFKKKYLDLFDTAEATRLSDSELEQIANPRFLKAAFATKEYAIEPRAIAEKLREALNREPSVNLLLHTTVDSVERNGNQFNVYSTDKKGKKQKETYTDVVNATWAGRLLIDKQLNIPAPAAWSFRYKFGNKILIPLQRDEIPSVTMVQGPFGDTVNFRDRGMFLSWYPIGRTGWSEEHSPPDWDAALTDEERMRVFNESFEQIAHRVPSVRNLTFKPEDVHPVGGVIYALGNSDVDDVKSKLHVRYQAGIESHGNYHSVNTGKYTLIPYLGVKIADRIEGIS